MNQAFLKSLQSFHEDEDGMEVLQVVMILGIAAIVLLALILLWDKIWPWADEGVTEVTIMKTPNKKGP